MGLAAFACVLLVVLFVMINKYGRRSKFGMKGEVGFSWLRVLLGGRGSASFPPHPLGSVWLGWRHLSGLYIHGPHTLILGRGVGFEGW